MCCLGCSSTSNNHPLWRCDEFRKLILRGRWSLAKKAGCCYKCLNAGHNQNDCKYKYSCYICKRNDHHYLLSNSEFDKDNHDTSDCATGAGYPKVNDATSFNVLCDSDRKLLPIIPVKLSNCNNGRQVIVNCLLDTGSDTTLCSKKVADILQTNKKSTVDVCLHTANGETFEHGYKIDLCAEGIDYGACHLLNNVVDVTNVARHNNPANAEFAEILKFPHLQGLNIR